MWGPFRRGCSVGEREGGGAPPHSGSNRLIGLGPERRNGFPDISTILAEVSLLRVLPVLVSVFMTACTALVPVTIDVHTDLVPREEFDSVRIRVGDEEQDLPVGAADSFLPRARRLGDFRVASSAAVPVEVSLLRRGSTVLTRRVVLAVRQQLVVPVWLLRSCISVTCPDGSDPLATECDDGRCVRPECEGDGCMITGGCTASSECPAPPATCAEARCLEGRCAVVARAGACDTDSYCAPDRGCEPRTRTPDAGMPADGGTDAPVDAPLPACVDGMGCPATTTSDWSGCAFSDFCSESAPDETRVITRFPCVAGRCEAVPETESRACTRSRGGLECAPAVVGPFGDCTYTASCPIVGIREQTVTSYACAGGGCIPSSTVVRDSSGCPPFAEVCDLFDNDCDGSCDPGCRIPVLRSYRDTTQSHLFSTNASKAVCCDFHLESSAAFYLYSSNVGGGLVPLNRCYVPASNVHVYGTSGCEGVAGAVFEFELGYISPTPVFCGATALYRLTLGDRTFVTVEPGEVSYATSIGWTSHGAIGYVWSN
jgi:hypothetical protein